MSTSKHTPGPWAFSRWDQFGDTRFYVAQAEGAPYTPNYSDAATLIAETVSIERVRIQEANARLIAAAPEMLDALNAAEDLLHRMGMQSSDAYQEIDAAIAKATGGVK